MITQTALHGQARKKILAGVNAIYNAVKITLGPEGAGVLLHRSFNRGARITNDGVTIAKCVEPKDEFENLVATAFKEAAAKTGYQAGDGTTSTICVAAKLINDAFSLLKDENNSGIKLRGLENKEMGVNSLKKHILSEIPKIKEKIKEKTNKIKTLKELTKIADVSLGGNKEVAEIISKAVWDIGQSGFITVEDGFTGKLEVKKTEGARFPMKPIFLTNADKYEMVAEQCDVVVTDFKIETIRDFADIWDNLKVNKLIIFAPYFSDEVISTIAQIIMPKKLTNGQQIPSEIKIYPIKCPSLGSEDGTPHNFKDLAVFCGANFINTKEHKLKDIKDYDLGFLEKCTVKGAEDREDAVLIGGKGKPEEINARIEMLQSQKELTKLPEHKAFIDKRISSLKSTGGTIKVSAATDAEALPLKHKIEDAVSACQKALEYGYVKGGGLCLKEIADELFENDNLLKEALYAPYNQIQENCGKIEITEDIIDPARAVELEIENGLGVAANMITVKAIIPEFDDRDPHDGSKEIAKSIMAYTMMWAKREGLLQGGRDEAMKEQLQKYERLMEQEND